MNQAQVLPWSCPAVHDTMDPPSTTWAPTSTPDVSDVMLAMPTPAMTTQIAATSGPQPPCHAHPVGHNDSGHACIAPQG